MYCYDFSLVLPARPFRNKIWTQRKILKLWEMHDFERRQDGTVGTVVFFPIWRNLVWILGKGKNLSVFLKDLTDSLTHTASYLVVNGTPLSGEVAEI